MTTNSSPNVEDDVLAALGENFRSRRIWSGISTSVRKRRARCKALFSNFKESVNITKGNLCRLLLVLRSVMSDLKRRKGVEHLKNSCLNILEQLYQIQFNDAETNPSVGDAIRASVIAFLQEVSYNNAGVKSKEELKKDIKLRHLAELCAFIKITSAPTGRRRTQREQLRDKSAFGRWFPTITRRRRLTGKKYDYGSYTEPETKSVPETQLVVSGKPPGSPQVEHIATITPVISTTEANQAATSKSSFSSRAITQPSISGPEKNSSISSKSPSPSVTSEVAISTTPNANGDNITEIENTETSSTPSTPSPSATSAVAISTTSNAIGDNIAEFENTEKSSTPAKQFLNDYPYADLDMIEFVTKIFGNDDKHKAVSRSQPFIFKLKKNMSIRIQKMGYVTFFNAEQISIQVHRIYAAVFNPFIWPDNPTTHSRRVGALCIRRYFDKRKHTDELMNPEEEFELITSIVKDVKENGPLFYEGDWSLTYESFVNYMSHPGAIALHCLFPWVSENFSRFSAVPLPEELKATCETHKQRLKQIYSTLFEKTIEGDFMGPNILWMAKVPRKY